MNDESKKHYPKFSSLGNIIYEMESETKRGILKKL